MVMGPRELEGNGFVIGCKPVGSEGGTCSFKHVKRFPSGFDFVIAFPVDEKLVLILIDSILENFFKLPFILSLGINGNRFFGGGLKESWEGLEVWSDINAEVAAVDPMVDALPVHDKREVDFEVIVFVWSFRNREES